MTQQLLWQQFDGPAGAAGWRTSSTGWQYNGRYCKQTGERASYASVSATSYPGEGDIDSVPAVEVTLSASTDPGECAVEPRQVAGISVGCERAAPARVRQISGVGAVNGGGGGLPAGLYKSGGDLVSGGRRCRHATEDLLGSSSCH